VAASLVKKKGQTEGWYKPKAIPVCPLCAREIPPDQIDEHHLIPRLKGGKETTAMHRICHRHIHALFSESELAKKYNTVEALLEVPGIQKFVNWVKTKPIGFCDGTRKSNDRN
jgi:hypothetical protein